MTNFTTNSNNLHGRHISYIQIIVFCLFFNWCLVCRGSSIGVSETSSISRTTPDIELISRNEPSNRNRSRINHSLKTNSNVRLDFLRAMKDIDDRVNVRKGDSDLQNLLLSVATKIISPNRVNDEVKLQLHHNQHRHLATNYYRNRNYNKKNSFYDDYFAFNDDDEYNHDDAIKGKYHSHSAEYYGIDLTNYAIKYVGCRNVNSWSSDNSLELNRFVVFRLCDSNSCSSYNQYGCSSNYGEYMLPLENYLKLMADYYYKDFNKYCEVCSRCMSFVDNDDNTDDNVICNDDDASSANGSGNSNNNNNNYNSNSASGAGYNQYNNWYYNNQNGNNENYQNAANNNYDNNRNYYNGYNYNNNGGSYNRYYGGNNGYNNGGGSNNNNVNGGYYYQASNNDNSKNGGYNDNNNNNYGNRALYNSNYNSNYNNQYKNNANNDDATKSSKSSNCKKQKSYPWYIDSDGKCMYSTVCNDYSRACQLYQPNATGHESLFSCSGFYVGDSLRYLGPHCGRDGYTIDIGIFSDKQCNSYVGDTKDISQYTGQVFDVNELKSYYDKSCVSCSWEQSYALVNDSDVGLSNEINPICENLFEASAKCNHRLAGVTNIENDDNSVCEYIDSITYNRFDDSGDVVLPTTINGQNWQYATSYFGVVHEASVGQKLALAVTISLTIGLICYSSYLHKKLLFRKPWIPPTKVGSTRHYNHDDEYDPATVRRAGSYNNKLETEQYDRYWLPRINSGIKLTRTDSQGESIGPLGSAVAAATVGTMKTPASPYVPYGGTIPPKIVKQNYSGAQPPGFYTPDHGKNIESDKEHSFILMNKDEGDTRSIT